jgi:hypothetical protein
MQQHTLNLHTYLENPDECDGTYCRPYGSAELLSQLEGGKFKSVLHCRREKFAYDCTDEYFTTAVDFTDLRGDSGDGHNLQFSIPLASSCTSDEH